MIFKFKGEVKGGIKDLTDVAYSRSTLFNNLEELRGLEYDEIQVVNIETLDFIISDDLDVLIDKINHNNWENVSDL